jgi:heat shock protein HslJ
MFWSENEQICGATGGRVLLSGCVYNSKVSTGAEQLQHHRFVLTSVNGQAVTPATGRWS